MIRLALLSILVASQLFCSALAIADEKAVLAHVENMRDGAGFFQKDEFRKAALAWSNEAVALLERETSKSATLAAGFASVLASIAYQRAEDALSYAEWGNAVKHFLSAGTSWDEQRDLLFNYLAQVKKQLDAAIENGASAHIDTNLQFLIALDGVTGFSVYDQPDDGLRMQGGSQAPAMTENRSYFARPLSVVKEDESAQNDEQSERIASALQHLMVGSPPLVEPIANATPHPQAQAGDGSRERPFRIVAGAISEKTSQPGREPKSTPQSTGADAGIVGTPAAAKTTPKLSATKVSTTRSANPAVAVHKTTSQPASQVSIEKNRDYRLHDQDLERAKRAWSYFQRNRHPGSGLVSSVEGSAEVSSWDLAGQLAAIVSAHQVGVIDEAEFNRQAKSMLRALQTLALVEDRLPNRSYRVDTAQMSAVKSGWSAISTGRLLIWLRILANWYPELRTGVMAVISRWQFSLAIANGQLNSAIEKDGALQLQQEGRLGFEQYAAAGFALWGLEVGRALAIPETDWVHVYDRAVQIDKRPSSYLVSDPFVLGAMELAGIHPQFSAIAKNVFEVQRARWSNQKILTAMGHDVHHPTGQAVTNYIYHADQGAAFHCALLEASTAPCQAISTKIAYSWNALYHDAYSQALIDVVEKGVSSVRGFYSGVFDDLTVNRVLTLDANATVLESLMLKFRNGEPFLQGVTDGGALPLLISRGSWD